VQPRRPIFGALREIGDSGRWSRALFCSSRGSGLSFLLRGRSMMLVSKLQVLPRDCSAPGPRPECMTSTSRMTGCSSDAERTKMPWSDFTVLSGAEPARP